MSWKSSLVAAFQGWGDYQRQCWQESQGKIKGFYKLNIAGVKTLLSKEKILINYRTENYIKN